MLPKVTKEVGDITLLHDSEHINFTNWAKEMENENPELYRLMKNYIILADKQYGPDSDTGTQLLSLGIAMYHLLRTQAEIDEMDKQWIINNSTC